MALMALSRLDRLLEVALGSGVRLSSHDALAVLSLSNGSLLNSVLRDLRSSRHTGRLSQREYEAATKALEQAHAVMASLISQSTTQEFSSRLQTLQDLEATEAHALEDEAKALETLMQKVYDTYLSPAS